MQEASSRSRHTERNDLPTNMTGADLIFESHLIDAVARVSPGCAPNIIETVERDAKIAFPKSHRDFLLKSDGAEAFGGYFRIFGAHADPQANMTAWNEEDIWKFAWDGRGSDFWCFAETAWGDQYAYAIGAMTKGADPEVYLLDCLSMTPQKVSDNFLDFLANEFLRCAKEPYDDMIVAARRWFGDLEPKQHLIYTPSILLGADEDIDNVTVMDARAAMICNGDIAVQLDEGPEDGSVKAVEPYEDDLQRMRLRLIWA